MRRITAPSLLTAITALLVSCVPILTALAFTSSAAAARLGAEASKRGAMAGVIFAAPTLLCALFGGALLLRARRLPKGFNGRTRLCLLGESALAYGLSALPLHILAPQFFAPMRELLIESPIELLPTLSDPARIAVNVALVTAIAHALLGFAATLSTWWLVPQRARSIALWALDLSLLAAAAALWAQHFRAPAAEALSQQAARLSLTFMFSVRVFARLLPIGLDGLETVNFRSLVASRHLRAKKSGFLAAISFLSILAVSVSTCALTTVLSVMGGFRQDLKRKILGNNAHIVIDRPEDRIDAYEALVAAARGVPEVRGVSPYVSGEVMISSASNLAGAVLRGIDVARIGEVSELPTSMRMGSLDYLAHPEKLTRLPASQTGIGTSFPKVERANDESDAKPAPKDAVRLTDAVGKALDAAKKDLDVVAPPAEEMRTLPGIVVGQELARSLRLYVGDEVNVVTPLGELGPTGPMPKSRAFRVAGVFYSGMYEYDMKFAYVTLASAQRFLGAGDRVTGIEITVREPDRAQEVTDELKRTPLLAPLRVRAWQELNKNLFGALALEKLAMFIALGIAILVASFCIFATLTLMVQEKGREVGVLKAMGTADRAIVGIFMLEGTLIGLFGALLGLAMGYLVCFGAERFGVRLNPEVYYIDRLPVHVDPAEFLTVGIAAVFVCLIVTIYPAKLASRLRPVDALRYE